MEQQEIEKEIEELKFSLEHFDKGLEVLTNYLRLEAQNRVLRDPEVIDQELKQLNTEVEKLDQQLVELKKVAGNKRDEHTALEKRYNAMEEHLKKDNWSILTKQLDQINREVMSTEKTIGELEAKKFQLYQKIGVMDSQKQIHEEGVTDFKSENDPRVLEMIEEKKRNEARLAELEALLANR